MKVFSVKEVADIFKVKVQAVYNWINTDKIKTTKTPGGEIRIPESEIKKFTEISED